MGLVRFTQPTVEPVSLAEAKLHCKVECTDDDDLIGALITAAREQAEHRCGRTIPRCQWRLTLDRFPDQIRLPMPTVVQVLTLQYRAADGQLLTADSAGYTLDAASHVANWLYPAAGYAWPDTWCQPNGVVVTYEAGFAPDQVPQTLRQWMLLAVGLWYRHREAVMDTRSVELPGGFLEGLLDPWRVPQV